jgi:hypothetical protein
MAGVASKATDRQRRFAKTRFMSNIPLVIAESTQ